MKLHAVMIAVFGMSLFAGAPVAAAEGQKMCPMIYKPVCALRADGKRSTFGNKCEADRAGAKILHNGACEAGTVCSDIVMPVCAIDPATGREKTYTNMCWAEMDNAAYLHKGKCRN